MRLLLFFISIPFLFCMAEEPSLEFTVSQPASINAKEPSIGLHLSHQFSFCLGGSKHFKISPKIGIDPEYVPFASFAAGIFHDHKVGTFGHHLFYNYNYHQLTGVHLHQVGHTMDFVRKNIASRVTFYLPVTKPLVGKALVLHPVHWIEGEVLRDCGKLILGGGAHYDFNRKNPGLHAKVIFPVDRVKIGGIFKYDQFNQFSTSLFLSLRLLGTEKRPFTHSGKIEAFYQKVDRLFEKNPPVGEPPIVPPEAP